MVYYIIGGDCCESHKNHKDVGDSAVGRPIYLVAGCSEALVEKPLRKAAFECPVSGERG